MEEYNTKTIITDSTINWSKIRNACMTTISKDGGDKEPSSDWKKKLLMCEHSPIRRGAISWKWEEIPYAVTTHFVRHHVGVEKWVATSRSDRTGVDRKTRSQMDCVRIEMEANIQALINISRKRLCMCADPITRSYWISLMNIIKEMEPEVYWACVPECIRCGACPEYKPCGLFEKLFENESKESITNIYTRYDIYNDKRN